PERGEVLLGDARHRMRPEKYPDGPHRLHRRRRLRDLHPARREDQRPSLVRDSGSGKRVWHRPLWPGRTQHAASRRLSVSLRPRNLGHHQRVGSLPGSFLQNGEARLHRPSRAGESESGTPKENAGRSGNGRPRHSPRWLQDSRRSRKRDRLRNQRFSRAIPEKKYCASLCPARPSRDWNRAESRDPRTRSKSKSSADAILQTSEESVNRGHRETKSKSEKLRARSQELLCHTQSTANIQKNMSGSLPMAPSASPTTPRNRSATSCSWNSPRWEPRSLPASPSARSSR